MKTIVTTSWDDGHKLDMRLAALLKKYGIKGTFYICPQDHEFECEDLLMTQDILSISKDFEIGGHTITHPHLSEVAIATADEEIAQSKSYLEELLQREVTAFCYPYGDYNDEVKGLVKKNGYKLARTTKRYAFDITSDVFELPTTIHAFRYSLEMHKILSFSGFSLTDLEKYWNWEKLAISLFNRIYLKGGIFHIWGHSWEIDANNGWKKLENVFAYVATKNNVLYQNNTEVVNNY